MNDRGRISPLLPLLALSVTLALAAPAHAQYGRDPGRTGISASLRVDLGGARHWTSIRGTQVEEIPTAERPSYDMFRFGGSYYAYDNDRWYSSPQESGDFQPIDDSAVPSEFSSIPRDHWRNYPSRWQGRPEAAPSGTYGSLQVDLGNGARWSGIRGTRVREIRQGNRPDYDMFGYGDSYYVYNNNRWYSSRNQNGRFDAIDDRAVPREFSNIPRTHWRNYPSQWQGRRDGRMGGARGTLQVSFRGSPRWTGIRGTRVSEIRQADRPDYDMFGYGGSYYVYSDSRWYSSHRRSGQFTEIDDRSVPSAFTDIPRSHWRNYPAGWQDTNGDRR